LGSGKRRRRLQRAAHRVPPPGDERRAPRRRHPRREDRRGRVGAGSGGEVAPDSGGHSCEQRRPECGGLELNRKSTRLNSSHSQISYAVFCLKKKKKKNI